MADSENSGRPVKPVIRMCIGCRQRFPQKTLIRFVADQKENMHIDTHNRLPGRGAYVCYAEPCIYNAFKAPKRINFFLRTQLTHHTITQFEKVLRKQARPAHSTPAQKEG